MSTRSTAARNVLLLGGPVAQSVSPTMHRAAFAAAGLDGWTYGVRHVQRGDLEQAWHQLRADPNVAGLNVTIPLKEAMIPLMDEVAPDARAAGSVNTVVIDGLRRAIGDSTDGAGFMAALARVDGRVRRRAVILGTGGAARAVAASLRTVGCEVLILGRNLDAGERIAKELDVAFEPWSFDDDQRLRRALSGADLLASAIPRSLADAPPDSPVPAAVDLDPAVTVFDLVYRPRRTALLERAAAAGCLVVEGIEMLIEQGARSFELWTARPAPVDVMRAAAYRALDGQVG